MFEDLTLSVRQAAGGGAVRIPPHLKYLSWHRVLISAFQQEHLTQQWLALQLLLLTCALGIHQLTNGNFSEGRGGRGLDLSLRGVKHTLGIAVRKKFSILAPP